MAIASKSFDFGVEDSVTQVGANAGRGVGQSVIRVNV